MKSETIIYPIEGMASSTLTCVPESVEKGEHPRPVVSQIPSRGITSAKPPTAKVVNLVCRAALAGALVVGLIVLMDAFQSREKYQLDAV